MGGMGKVIFILVPIKCTSKISVPDPFLIRTFLTGSRWSNGSDPDFTVLSTLLYY